MNGFLIQYGENLHQGFDDIFHITKIRHPVIGMNVRVMRLVNHNHAACTGLFHNLAA